MRLYISPDTILQTAPESTNAREKPELNCVVCRVGSQIYEARTHGSPPDRRRTRRPVSCVPSAPTGTFERSARLGRTFCSRWPAPYSYPAHVAIRTTHSFRRLPVLAVASDAAVRTAAADRTVVAVVVGTAAVVAEV